MLRHRFVVLALIASFASSTGCIPSIKPPAPDLGAKPLPTPDLSVVLLPVTVSLATVRSQAEAQVPRTFHVDPYNLSIDGGADNCGTGVSIGYNVDRSDLTMTGSGNTLHTGMGVGYWVKARAKRHFGPACPLISGSCGVGEPLRTASLLINTAIAVTPDWRVDSRTNAAPVAAGNRCTVTILNKDVTDQVLNAFNHALGQLAGSLDAKIVAAADLRTRMEQAWQALQAPIEVAPTTWLTLNPQGAGVSPLALGTSDLNVSAQLQGRPVITFGEKPTVTTHPLPDAIAPRPGNAYSLAIPIAAKYDAVSAQLRKAFHIGAGGTRYPAVGRPSITIIDVELYGLGPQAVVRAEFKGSAKGTLYLSGTPTFDAGRNVVSFPDLEYTLETKNLILKVASWLKHEELRNDLRNKAVIDVSPEIARARALATQAINRPVGPMQLTGTVDRLQVLGVYTNPAQGSFDVLTAANGTLNAAVP